LRPSFRHCFAHEPPSCSYPIRTGSDLPCRRIMLTTMDVGLPSGHRAESVLDRRIERLSSVPSLITTSHGRYSKNSDRYRTHAEQGKT
jgi:hypothetical protein